MAEKVLVVDDEHDIADLLEVYLGNENYDVFKYYSAREALDCIENQEIDLAILDIMLPDINGFSLCQKIREKYTYPIIMLTAKDEETDMDTNMRATLCEQTLENACKAYPMLRGAILHSDRGTQYTSELYRKAINRYGIVQSMNSAGGRCHDNARCESMWARFKEELLYGRYDPTSMTVEQLKTLIWRYFISYWNNRRICSANGGLPPMVKRQQYYASLQEAA